MIDQIRFFSKFYTLLLGFILVGSTNTIVAQQANSNAEQGTIRGTVIEDATGETLIGVNILVQGTNYGISTDVDGNFEIKLPPGTYDLRFSYISFQTKIVENVQIEPEKINVLGTIRLSTTTNSMGEVVVSAQRVKNSETAMLTIKKKSANLVDGISSEVMNQSGVSNAAAALKKVTGVSIQDDKYVYVRGLGGRYTKTMLNSVEIPSLDPNRNSLQVDIFPANLIANMVINKTAVAEIPADFTGGIVNIETKDFPEEPVYEFSAGVSYNPQMHFNSNYLTAEGSNTDFLGFDGGTRELPDGAEGSDIPTPVGDASDQKVYNFVNSFNPNMGPHRERNNMDYSLGMSLGDQYSVGGGNKLGYIFTGTYKNTTTHYDDFRYGEYQIPSGATNYDLVYATRQRGRVSENNVLLGGLAGLAFKTENSKYRLTGLHLQNGETRASNFFVDNSQSAPGQSGYLGDSFNIEYGERSISNVLLNVTHFFGGNEWELDWKLSPTFSQITDPDVRRTTYTRSQNNGEPVFNAGAGGFPGRIWRFLDEVNLVGRVNVVRDYELFGAPAKFKFGGSHVYKQRDYEIRSFDMAFFGGIPELDGNPDEVLQDENIYGNGNGGTIYFTSGNPTPNPNAYSSNSNNTAFYVSNEFNVTPDLKAYVGLRVENFTLRHTGRDVRYAQGDESANNLDNEKVLNALDFFPSANLNYSVTVRSNLRFSYSRTIARPSFKELSFAQILDPISDRIFNGGLFAIGSWDGNLSETRVNNFDVRWETYFEGNQLLSFSLFYKSFKDPIELVRIRAQVTSNEYQPRNVGDGDVYGAEFEMRKSLGFISPAIQDFGFNTNVTLAQSIINISNEELQARRDTQKEGQNIDDTRQMAGQAPYVINAGISYTNSDTGLEGGLFYNVKGETLILVGGGLFPDVYSEPFHSLRFNLQKEFGATSINLSVDNILNDIRGEYYQAFRSDQEIYNEFNPHRTISVGFKYSF